MTRAREAGAPSRALCSLAVAVAPAVDGRNEDAWGARFVEAERLVLAVVDGASLRIALDESEPDLVGGIARDIAATLVAPGPGRPTRPPRARLAHANRRVRQRLMRRPILAAVLGLLDAPPMPLQAALSILPQAIGRTLAGAFVDAFGALDELDSRHLRLVLPACVATVAAIDLSSGWVEFAHVGDTALVRVRADRAPEVVTEDQMVRFDREVLDLALQVAGERPADGPAADRLGFAAATRDPRVRRLDRLNGVRHNFVDVAGSTIPGEGCGVVDGLTQMEAYIQDGAFRLDADETLALLSDGMALPLASAPAVSSSVAGLVERWVTALRTADAPALAGSIDALVAADPDLLIYPRMRHRDDATALMVRIGRA